MVKVFGYNIRPEIDKPLYYVHLGILAFVVLGILQLWKGGEMLTWNTWLMSIPLLLVGDIVAHSILRLD